MKTKKTSVFSSGLIWFGAAVSIAEILTGTLLAPLGFEKGLAATIIGHAIGCMLLYLAGIIGAKTEKSAMETVKFSFGHKGSLLFAVLNILQLVGWTAVMIIGGARAAGVILNPVFGTQGEALWAVVISALIILWIVVGVKSLERINTVAMSLLFITTIVLCTVVFGKGSGAEASGGISFGAAVELSAAMPLSWLPLISDYTRNAEKPQAATLTSVLVYFFTSCWMYAVGLGAAIFTGQSDIAKIMLQAGLGLIGVFIIIFSTVTTTYLDTYSAGVSFTSITNRINEKLVAVIVCILGMLLAIFTPIEQYENFLYLIGSVFAPMIAILITDFFIFKKSSVKEAINIVNLLIWVAGFIIYRLFMSVDTVVGSTLPVMIITSVISIIVNGGIKLCSKES